MILSVNPVQASLETFRRLQVDGVILFEENADVAGVMILAVGLFVELRKQTSIFQKISQSLVTITSPNRY